MHISLSCSLAMELPEDPMAIGPALSQGYFLA
jgi:hypothetical protein